LDSIQALAMTKERLISLGLPIVVQLLSTAVLARPMHEQGFKWSLQRIWSKDQQRQ
jgi:hypothetical protein